MPCNLLRVRLASMLLVVQRWAAPCLVDVFESSATFIREGIDGLQSHLGPRRRCEVATVSLRDESDERKWNEIGDV